FWTPGQVGHLAGHDGITGQVEILVNLFHPFFGRAFTCEMEPAQTDRKVDSPAAASVVVLFRAVKQRIINVACRIAEQASRVAASFTLKVTKTAGITHGCNTSTTNSCHGSLCHKVCPRCKSIQANTNRVSNKSVTVCLSHPRTMNITGISQTRLQAVSIFTSLVCRDKLHTEFIRRNCIYATLQRTAVNQFGF